MAVKMEGAPWFTVGRLLAFFALVLVVLELVVPGMPDWTLALAVILLALGLLLS